MHKRTALIVEDDPSIAKIMTLRLGELGYTTFVTASATAAINLVRMHRPDLVSVDLVLAEGSGFDVCEEIRRDPELKGTPIMVTTSRTSPTERAMALEMGVTGFLLKPFKEMELLREVQRATKTKPEKKTK